MSFYRLNKRRVFKKFKTNKFSEKVDVIFFQSYLGWKKSLKKIVVLLDLTEDLNLFVFPLQ